MIVFVLLVYSEIYFEKAIHEINILSRKILSNKIKIIVVNNNHNLYVENSIVGNNEGFEFSGWDSSIKFIDQEAEYIVFANDTFCHHREWNEFQRQKFASSFNKMIKHKRIGICGDVNSFHEEFNLCNQSLDGWVSSYLFMISSNIIFNPEFKFDSVKNYYNHWVLELSEHEKIIFSSDFDTKLGLHLNNWLFPNGKNGWYKAKNSEIEQKENKLYSILNEKLLTANVLSANGTIYDVNKFLCLNFFKQTKRNFYQIIVKLGTKK